MPAIWTMKPRVRFIPRMLNGEVPELELGGILIALRIKGEGEAEMRGFLIIQLILAK